MCTAQRMNGQVHSTASLHIGGDAEHRCAFSTASFLKLKRLVSNQTVTEINICNNFC